MLTTTLGRFGPAARKRLSFLSRPLAALGLLLATAGATQAQSTLTFTGTLTATDPTIPGDRLYRDGNPSVCGTNKTYPGTNSGVAGVHYDTYTFNASSATCVTITLMHNCTEATTPLVFGSAYTGSFTATDLSLNYKGDMGASPQSGTNATMGLTVAAGQTVVLVVNGLTGVSSCSSYTLTASAAVPLNTGAAPTLTSISPTSATAGTSVTLTGSNLSGATAVTFAGTSNNTVTTGLTVSSSGSSQTLTVPVPTGATSGPVTVTTPGGTSNGVAFTVLVPPANDDCANATQLTVAATCAPTAGTTVGATQSLAAITCNGFTGTADDDVWYKFTASAATQTVTVVGSANIDAVVDVRAGSCGNSTNIGCADATATGGTESVTLSGLTPGSTYYVRVYGYGTAPATAGAFTICVTAPSTAAPVVTSPAANSTTNGLPTFAGTAPAGSTVTLYLAMGSSPAQVLGTTTATGGSFSLVPATALASGTYSVYATAQSSGATGSANSNTNTFTVDATPPTATISTTASSPTSTAPLPFAVSFSEPVTGLLASSLTVSNGTVTSGSLTSSGPNTYAFSVTPTGNGPVTVNLAANAVRDAVGNGNVASNTVSVQYSAPVASGLSVQYQTGDLGQPQDGQVRPFLQLVNSGATAVPYSSLTVRYWLTPENFMGQLVTPIDYAKLGTSFVSARYVALATPRQGALGYIEYSFAAGAGNLNPGTDSGPIYGKAYKPDYSNFDETDDWSYQTSSSFTSNDHVTLYQNGTLIAGTEPPAVASTTALNVYSASRDASASPQFVSVQVQVRNTGNRPVNYSDLTARYYFTRDGATAIVPQVDYAKLGANNISLRVVVLPTAVSGADAYLEVSFSAALGVFYPRTSTDDILVKLRKDNYQALDQTNDYSFTGSTSLLVNNRFPAYLNGGLIFGTPPAGSAARMAAPSTGGATIVAAAGGPQALTASPNPFGEQLTLRFALPTTQAYTLAVYDGQGRLVQQVARGEAEAEQAQEVAVPTQGYAAGLYLVRLTTASGVQTLKLVKQ